MLNEKRCPLGLWPTEVNFLTSQETRILSQSIVPGFQMLRPCLKRFLGDALHTASEQVRMSLILQSFWFLTCLFESEDTPTICWRIGLNCRFCWQKELCCPLLAISYNTFTGVNTLLRCAPHTYTHTHPGPEVLQGFPVGDKDRTVS